MITSCWKLTFDPAGTPLVILDYGDRIEDELKFGLGIGCEVVPLIDSNVPFLRASGNGVYEVGFTRLLNQASDKLARGAALDWLVDHATLAKKPLKIEMLGGTYATYQFSAAVIKRHESQRRIMAPTFRYALDFQITAAGLTRTLI